MLKTLIKIRLQGIFFQSVKSNKKQNASIGKIILMLLLFAYIIVVFGVMFGIMFNEILTPFKLIGYEWLYFAIMAVLILILCFIGSVFVTQQELYGAKDNELLLSMPIKEKDLLLSRLSVLLIINYLYEALIVIPCLIVYFSNVSFDIIKFLIFVIVVITLPLLALTLSCVFGWFMAMILKKIKNKTLITMIISIGCLGIYIYVVNKIPDYLAALLNNGKTIGEAIQNTLYPVYYLAIAISQKDMIGLLIYLLCVFVPFILVIYLLSKNFINIATTKTATKKIKVKEKDIKCSSLKLALFKREVRHFISNPMIMLNGAMGIVFTVVLAGALLIKGPELIELLDIIPPQLQGYVNEMIVPLSCMAVIATNSLNIISASLISLEGNSLWILKSLPIKTIDILNSKLFLHLAMCIPPGIIFSLISCITFSLSPLDCLIVIVAPIIFTIFVAQLGLLMNLWKPKLDWVNETVVVKQSAAVIITMLVTIALVFFISIGYVKLNNYNSMSSYFNSWVILFTVADFCFYYLLKTWGVKKFDEL